MIISDVADGLKVEFQRRKSSYSSVDLSELDLPATKNIQATQKGTKEQKMFNFTTFFDYFLKFYLNYVCCKNLTITGHLSLVFGRVR